MSLLSLFVCSGKGERLGHLVLVVALSWQRVGVFLAECVQGGENLLRVDLVERGRTARRNWRPRILLEAPNGLFIKDT